MTYPPYDDKPDPEPIQDKKEDEKKSSKIKSFIVKLWETMKAEDGPGKLVGATLALSVIITLCAIWIPIDQLEYTAGLLWALFGIACLGWVIRKMFED